MVAGKPHSMHRALHLGIHADMVWRKVNLKKNATQSPVAYGGSVWANTEHRNEKETNINIDWCKTDFLLTRPLGWWI